MGIPLVEFCEDGGRWTTMIQVADVLGVEPRVLIGMVREMGLDDGMRSASSDELHILKERGLLISHTCRAMICSESLLCDLLGDDHPRHIVSPPDDDNAIDGVSVETGGQAGPSDSPNKKETNMASLEWHPKLAPVRIERMDEVSIFMSCTFLKHATPYECK